MESGLMIFFFLLTKVFFVCGTPETGGGLGDVLLLYCGHATAGLVYRL